MVNGLIGNVEAVTDAGEPIYQGFPGDQVAVTGLQPLGRLVGVGVHLVQALLDGEIHAEPAVLFANGRRKLSRLVI